MDDPREWLQSHVREMPAQAAVSDAQQSWSFAQLDEVVRRLANGLERTGMCENARVVFAARKSVLGVALALACFREGMAFLPIDADVPLARLKSMLATARPSLIVTDRQLLVQHATEAGIAVIDPRELAAASAERTSGPAPFDPERIAYMMFTSGSNGDPKAVCVPWRALSALYAAITEYYPVQRGSRCLNTAPAYFDVSVLDTWFPLFAGAHVRLMQPEDMLPPRFLAILSRESIQFMCCVSPQLKLVADCGSLIEHFDLTSLHTIMTGAESPDPQAVQRWLTASPGLRLLNGYGPTEATCVCTVYVIERTNGSGPVPYPIGRFLAGTTCMLSSERDHLDSSASEGELWVGGPQVMRGYFGDEAQTSAKLVTVEGRVFYRTGDRVKRLASGDLIYLGRVDEEVKVAGYRINLAELTTIASSHPRVRESFAAAVLFQPTGFKRIALAVRLDHGENDRVVADVYASLEDKLPKYMMPAWICPLREFPRLGSGKLDKRGLAEILTHEANAA